MRKDLDLAQKPLFHRVNEEKLREISIYVNPIQLLDNYQLDNQRSEIVTRAHKAEIDWFIDSILVTEPIQIARKYIKDRLNGICSADKFEWNLRNIWFESYTNYFGDVAIKDASGFEHIFVGEGK